MPRCHLLSESRFYQFEININTNEHSSTPTCPSHHIISTPLLVLIYILVSFHITMIKYYDKSNSRVKGFILFHSEGTAHYGKEVKAAGAWSSCWCKVCSQKKKAAIHVCVLVSVHFLQFKAVQNSWPREWMVLSLAGRLTQSTWVNTIRITHSVPSPVSQVILEFVKLTVNTITYRQNAEIFKLKEFFWKLSVKIMLCIFK